jgi:hypothetical protein
MSNLPAKSLVRIATLILVLLPLPALAIESLGDVAQNLMAPTAIVTKLVDVACYMIGIAFVLVSFAQYKIHRQSPKLVPLTTPILLLVLGIVALMIPYTTKVSETGAAKLEAKQATTLPMPTTTTNGPGIPYPPGTQAPSTGNEAAPASNDLNPAPPPPPPPQSVTPDSGTTNSGGSWTQDPKYNQ